jgi:hypothetical protein
MSDVGNLFGPTTKTKPTAPLAAAVNKLVKKPTKTKPGSVAPKKPVADSGWEQAFVGQYPQYGWMLTDLDRTKYADVFSLFQKAVNPKTKYTDARFQAEFGGSSWFRELQSSNAAVEIKNAVGTLDWDGSSYGKLLSDAVHYGWKGDQLKQESYKQLFAKKADGTYVNSAAVEQAKNTAPYMAYAKTAKAYFSTVPSDRVEKALSGEITDQDVVDGLRASAKLKYAHLAPALDAGQTLEDLSGDYRTLASKLLERPEADIDMSNPDYEIALAYQDGSTKRMMTTGEWQRMLKSDKKYGWEKTKQAVDLGRNIGLSIVQNFQRGM